MQDDCQLDSFDLVPEHHEQLLINRMELSKELQVRGAFPRGGVSAPRRLQACAAPHIWCPPPVVVRRAVAWRRRSVGRWHRERAGGR